MSSEYTVHSEGSSRLSIIQEQMNDETHSTCQGSSAAFDDLRRDYKDAIQCIVHCELLIKTLEGQLTTKDDIIASLEDKIVSMSLELAKAKAASDELELSQRRMSSSLPILTSDYVEEQSEGPSQRHSWAVEDDEDSSSYDEEEDFEQGLIDLNDDIGLDGVEDNCLPLRRVPDKRKRRGGLGQRTLSAPIEPESPPALPTNNGRAFSKSLPGGGHDIDDSDCWESARSQLDESTSSRGFDFGQLFGRKGSQEGIFNNKKNRRRSSADCSNNGEDMELSDPSLPGLDESSSSRGISGLGALFQRKNRRPSVVPEDNTVDKKDDAEEEDFNDIINNGGRRTMSKARLDRQTSNRNFLSAVCFPMEDEDVDAGLNDRSFVKKLKEMKEKDEADALAAATAFTMPRPIKKNEVVDDNKSTAIQRTIARREAMKKQRAVASGAPSVPDRPGMGERPGMEKSWY